MTSDKQDILVYAHCLPSVVKKKKKKTGIKHSLITPMLSSSKALRLSKNHH